MDREARRAGLEASSALHRADFVGRTPSLVILIWFVAFHFLSYKAYNNLQLNKEVVNRGRSW